MPPKIDFSCASLTRLQKPVPSPPPLVDVLGTSVDTGLDGGRLDSDDGGGEEDSPPDDDGGGEEFAPLDGSVIPPLLEVLGALPPKEALPAIDEAHPATPSALSSTAAARLCRRS
ncbi:MAG: hypothetical protein DLM56_13565 [Pseudonocardiales bacterium]|nr:MAG: hypothetical protein DLM56_13565 [Pseudonocardiales bacterium]